MNNVRNSTLLLAALALIGCPSPSEDVSQFDRYSELVGGRYQTKAELIVHSVTFDPDVSKRVDMLVITNEPGFSGPEVVGRTRLDSGRTLEVIKVRRRGVLFGSVISLDVKAEPPVQPASPPVTLRGVGKGILVDAGGRLELDSALFERLK